jgi:2-dehydro-3-deoxyphosphooctonate aldolase (KDO 8-P synthase)
MEVVEVGGVKIGGGRLALIAGPCVAESLDLSRTVAAALVEITSRLEIPYIFKASFDKANRSSGDTPRGPGMDDGLQILSAIKREFGVPVTTDVHLPDQCSTVAEVVDLLQIPAFLCRQTDLLLAAAATGKPVNVKKGQFLAPWDCKNIVDKLRHAGAKGIALTERGTTFGYNTLIVDMAGLPIMRSLGVPVIFDATHSAQRPGAAGTVSGGNREAIPPLARAAVAAGVDGIFMEIHPDPERALSDPATQWPLAQAEPLLRQLVEIARLVSD